MAKEKEIQVKQKAEKIAEKHLTQLQNIINGINALQFNIGKMEVNKFNAMKDLAKSQSEVSDMQDILLNEYGTYDVSVHDGTINWPETKTESNGVDKPKEDEK
tara:strand:+ start:223 stop:531 length:309 start_codon:yes stop_codon:yes gene_type:complete